MSALIYKFHEEKAKRLALRTHTNIPDQLLGRSSQSSPCEEIVDLRVLMQYADAAIDFAVKSTKE